MMRLSHVLIVGTVILTTMQCRDIGTGADSRAKITVYVHWGDTPISQKKVELIQTGEVKQTDQKGLAEFAVPPGSYVIRVYGINRGGPVSLYVDFNLDLKPSENRTLDVVDCLPCV